MRPRIGVYICHCGLNIANTVDVEAVSQFASGLPNVVAARHYTYMCSDPGQGLITEDIRDLQLTHVVVASCSPRMHELTFRNTIQKAGLNPYCLEVANIREQCSWVHTDRVMATQKAKDLLASAVAKVAWLVPLQERQVGVTQAVLVIGGGVAGMQVALDIAEAGFKAYLVEREPYLGGRALQLSKTFPTLEEVSDLISPLIQRVVTHPEIQVITGGEVEKVEGFVGNFRVTVRERPRWVDPAKCTVCGKCADVCPISLPDAFNPDLTERRAIHRPSPNSVPATYVVESGDCTFIQDCVCGASHLSLKEEGRDESVTVQARCAAVCPEQAIDFGRKGNSAELAVGAIIVATGAATFNPETKPELGYGTYPNVITSLQLERLASASGPTGGQIRVNGKEPQEVVFVQCVGSRDETTGNHYCSRICCMVTTKQAHLIKQTFPGAKVTVFYADVRTFGKGHEEFYDEVRKEGVRYRRGYVSEVYRRDDKIVVRAEDTLMQKPIAVQADLVVLSVGLTPRPETNAVAGLLGLTRSGDGFLAESHPKLRPVDTMVDGVFLAGTCQGPKDIVDTLAQARAAASSALAPLCRGQVKVESATSFVDVQVCAGCGLCVAACAYGALTLSTRTHKAKVNAVLCKGCGACAAACPSKAIQVMQFTPRQILSQIAVLA